MIDRYLPGSLEPLRGIECLKLSQNKINFLADLSVLADSLTHLDLNENELVELVGFGTLEKLRVCFFSFCVLFIFFFFFSSLFLKF